jgi:hypothetical protein
MRGAVPAKATEVFKNERRERLGRITILFSYDRQHYEFVRQFWRFSRHDDAPGLAGDNSMVESVTLASRS